jgi:hypothetical protein
MKNIGTSPVFFVNMCSLGPPVKRAGSLEQWAVHIFQALGSAIVFQFIDIKFKNLEEMITKNETQEDDSA